MGLIKAKTRSKRFRTATVPDLYGLSAAEASEAGGNAGVIVQASDPGSPPLRQLEGTVVAQHPAAGAVLRFGAQVVVVLSGRGGSAGVREPRRPYPPVREDQAVAEPGSH